MLKKLIAIALLTAAACAAQANDWLIVPGKRLGPITATTTRLDLVRLFGAANVTEGQTSIGDATALPCTFVFKKQKDSTLAILWAEKKRHKQIEALLVCEEATGSSCRWRMADGTGFGTTLKVLEKMNGRPFKLNGFGW